MTEYEVKQFDDGPHYVRKKRFKAQIDLLSHDWDSLREKINDPTIHTLRLFQDDLEVVIKKL